MKNGWFNGLLSLEIKKIKKPKLLFPEKDLNNPDLSAKM
jgi:hypothetical protein